MHWTRPFVKVEVIQMRNQYLHFWNSPKGDIGPVDVSARIWIWISFPSLSSTPAASPYMVGPWVQLRHFWIVPKQALERTWRQTFSQPRSCLLRCIPEWRIDSTWMLCPLMIGRRLMAPGEKQAASRKFLIWFSSLCSSYFVRGAVKWLLGAEKVGQVSCRDRVRTPAFSKDSTSRYLSALIKRL